MLGARTFVLAASCVFACALQAALSPSAARAQSIDLSLNVFYATPSNMNSGGTWELVAKSSNFGIGGIEAHLKNIATDVERAPRGTVNGSDSAGFNIFVDVTFPTLIIGQAPIVPLPPGKEQSAFYGVGQLANGAPNYPGKPVGANFEGPAFTSFTSPIEIPWATGDAFSDAAWSTAARMASGTFATNMIPAFDTGSSGNVFTTLGSSTMYGTLVDAAVTTLVRTNFVPSADYNHNGAVDAADYVLWRKTNNTSVSPGTGADGTGNGTIDQADYDLWRSHFGNPFGAGSGGSLSTNGVPEPFTGSLLALGAILILCIHRQAPRRLAPAVSPAQTSTPTLGDRTKASAPKGIVFCANCK